MPYLSKRIEHNGQESRATPGSLYWFIITPTTQKYASNMLNISLSPTQLTTFYQQKKDLDAAPRYRTGFPVAQNDKKKVSLSTKAQRRLRKKINWLTFLSAGRRVARGKGKFVPDFKIAFVTLTLPAPQQHTAKELKAKALNRFLVVARAKWGIENYVWKMEYQKNGNVHFHLTWDKWVPYQAIRREWNNALRPLGYIKAYQNKMKSLSMAEYISLRQPHNAKEHKKAAKAYKEGKRWNWQNPNSTDVKKVKNVKNLAAYLSKYLIKDPAKELTEEQKEKVKEDLQGRLWFCSQSLSKLGNCIIPLSIIWNRILSEFRRLSQVREYSGDFFTCYFFRFRELPAKWKEKFRQELVSFAVKQGYPFPSSILKAGL